MLFTACRSYGPRAIPYDMCDERQRPYLPTLDEQEAYVERTGCGACWSSSTSMSRTMYSIPVLVHMMCLCVSMVWAIVALWDVNRTWAGLTLAAFLVLWLIVLTNMFELEGTQLKESACHAVMRFFALCCVIPGMVWTVLQAEAFLNRWTQSDSRPRSLLVRIPCREHFSLSPSLFLVRSCTRGCLFV